MSAPGFSARMLFSVAAIFFSLCLLGLSGCGPSSIAETTPGSSADQKRPVEDADAKSFVSPPSQELSELRDASRNIVAQLSAVQSEVALLRAELQQVRTQVAQGQSAAPTQSNGHLSYSVSQTSKHGTDTSDRPKKIQGSSAYSPNSSGVPRIYNVPQSAPKEKPVDFPESGSSLNAEQFRQLMAGDISFAPQSLPPSGRGVDDSTPLQAGQEILIEWKGSWWAGTVTGFEPDGAVRVSYFGWNRNWDEAVPRSDVQLGTNTREMAIQTIYSVVP